MWLVSTRQTLSSLCATSMLGWSKHSLFARQCERAWIIYRRIPEHSLTTKMMWANVSSVGTSRSIASSWTRKGADVVGLGWCWWTASLEPLRKHVEDRICGLCELIFDVNECWNKASTHMCFSVFEQRNHAFWVTDQSFSALNFPESADLFSPRQTLSQTWRAKINHSRVSQKSRHTYGHECCAKVANIRKTSVGKLQRWCGMCDASYVTSFSVTSASMMVKYRSNVRYNWTHFQPSLSTSRTTVWDISAPIVGSLRNIHCNARIIVHISMGMLPRGR